MALHANVAQFHAQMGAAAASVDNFGRNVNSTVAESNRQFQTLGKVGLALGAGFVAGAARDGWEQVLETSRAEWHDIQLTAAVRNNPQVALDSLRESGDLP